MEEAIGSDSFNLEDYMAFELRRGDQFAADPKDLAFDVVVKRKISDELEFKINFENPYMVSTGQHNDILVCEIKDDPFFSRVDEPVNVKPGTQVKYTLPQMLNDDFIENVAQAIHDAVSSAAQALVISNIFITILIVVSLKAMWTLLNTMQVLTYLQFFAPWPGIVDETMSKIFDAITLKPFIEPVLNFGKTKFQMA